MSGASRGARPASGYRLRLATLDDVPALRGLIARSARGLSLDDYTPEQVEGALLGAYGVDSALIRDGTYFVVLGNDDELVGCGGWSRRGTLFGSDAQAERNDAPLDPARDAARIRAFFVDPAHARRGIARLLLEASESAALDAGFAALELVATLPGVRLYEACGYERGSPVEHALPGGQSITFVPMRRVPGDRRS